MSFINLSSTDIVVSNDAVTAPAWTTGDPTLTSSSMYIYPTKSVAPEFYTDVYASSSQGFSSTPQFSVSYGQVAGSGSKPFNDLVRGASPTKTVYGQFRNMVYADENSYFNFGAGNTASADVYVINVSRQCYKESLFPGTFNLRLSVSGGFIGLTNDSNDVKSISYLDCGRVYNIVEGSDGSAHYTSSITSAGYHGLFLPDVGLIVLNPKALELPSGSGGVSLPVANSATSSNNFPNTDILVDAIKSGGSFKLNSYETVSSDYVFVRVPNSQFNYTTNPSVISGSGALIYSTMINNPQTYMTTIGLYNENQELLAVAKMSKPLVKDFTKEALIQCKLNW